MITATIRLGLAVSAVAVVLAIALSLVGDVTQWSYVALVAVAGFVSSWIQTGRYARVRT